MTPVSSPSHTGTRAFAAGRGEAASAAEKPTAARGGFPYFRTPPRPPVPPKVPAPPDLAEKAATMGRNALALHYGVSYNTMVRILKDAGVEAATTRAARRPETMPRRRPRPKLFQRAAPERNRTGYAGPKSAFVGSLPRDSSMEGEAADFLRRETRANIYRCTETGAYTETKTRRTHWRAGGAVLTGAELVERATSRGWNPDAWRQVGLAIVGCEADRARVESPC